MGKLEGKWEGGKPGIGKQNKPGNLEGKPGKGYWLNQVGGYWKQGSTEPGNDEMRVDIG